MIVPDVRTYGAPPYRVAVLHGGPGAPGDLAPVARRLAERRGVLEPLQSAATLEGQIAELARQLTEHAEPPVTLIGHSWGAQLGFLVAARHPALVRRLVMVASGVFTEEHGAGIFERRLARLGEEDRAEVLRLGELAEAGRATSDELMRFGGLLVKADSYDPLPEDVSVLEIQPEVNRGVWTDARQLLRSGGLDALGRSIRCPVVAIHGDYDPHPAEGVRQPLEAMVADFRFIEVPRCGHKPWIERLAVEAFYELLEGEIAAA